MSHGFDRSAEDVGNIVGLEHVNLEVPDQRLATLFYVTGLGLTRDPYLFTGITNMWINAGRTQFHLPTGEAQHFRGRIGVVLPDRDALLGRLQSVHEALSGTAYGFDAGGDVVDVTCPWGNRFRIHGPEPRFGRVVLGLAYVECDVSEGAAAGIAAFYREIFNAPARVDGSAAIVSVGPGQALVFRETVGAPAPYDGHHIQINIADFSGPHGRLTERGLISEESNQHQYRFEAIADPETGKELFRLEHEVRSMTHPLYARPLVNRNPEQTNRTYAPGYQDQSWILPLG